MIPVVIAASSGRSEKSLICKYPRQPNSSPHKIKVEKREVVRRPIGIKAQKKMENQGLSFLVTKPPPLVAGRSLDGRFPMPPLVQ